MIMTTSDAVFHYVENDGIRIVFVNQKSDEKFINVLVNDIKALPLTDEQAVELLNDGCPFHFGEGCLVCLGGRIQ
ncbi:hypothetical protein RB980_000389 [Vibrio fluvialis]|nr:hypothetical protein [Vibrio fluvialis]